MSSCASCPSSSAAAPTILKAICILNPDGNSGVSGVVKMEQNCAGGSCGPTSIIARITGLKQGLHGFHVHEFGNLTEGCKTAGGHYNPHKMTHGGPHSSVRHVGDLGNVEAGADGVAEYSLTDSQISLCGPFSIVGRSFVVHADPDDLGEGGFEDSKTTGHAGARLACGVIGMSNPAA